MTRNYGAPALPRAAVRQAPFARQARSGRPPWGGAARRASAHLDCIARLVAAPSVPPLRARRPAAPDRGHSGQPRYAAPPARPNAGGPGAGPPRGRSSARSGMGAPVAAPLCLTAPADFPPSQRSGAHSPAEAGAGGTPRRRFSPRHPSTQGPHRGSRTGLMPPSPRSERAQLQSGKK